MNAPYTPPTPADRVNATLARHAHLPAIIDHLQAYQAADIRYAQTQSEDALLDVLEATYKALGALEKVLGLDFDDYREDLRSEAIRECGFDLRTDEYTDADDAPGFDADDYADYRYEQMRDRKLDEQIDREMGR